MLCSLSMYSLIRSSESRSYRVITPAIPVQEEPQTLRTLCLAAHILPDDLAAHTLVLLVLGSHVQNYCQAEMDNHLAHRSVGWGEKGQVAESYKGHNHLADLDMTDCVEEDIEAGLGRSRHYSWSPEDARDTKSFVAHSRAY